MIIATAEPSSSTPRSASCTVLAYIASVSGGSITNGFVGLNCEFDRETRETFDETARKLASVIVHRGILTYVTVLVLVLCLAGVGTGIKYAYPYIPATAIVGIIVAVLVLLLLRGFLLDGKPAQ